MTRPAPSSGPERSGPGAARRRPTAASAQSCSLTQTVEVVGERWMFLILREALGGATRFSEFRTVLGIASDVLTARLGVLVSGGVMERREYHEPGQRRRFSYHLTDAGRELGLAVAALQQWGDRYLPSDLPALRFRSPQGSPVAVRFVDDRGECVAPTEVLVDHGRLAPGMGSGGGSRSRSVPQKAAS